MITEQQLFNITKGDVVHFVDGGSATVQSAERIENGVKLIASGSSLIYNSCGICRHASLLNIKKITSVYYAVVLDENGVPNSVTRIAATLEAAMKELAFMEKHLPNYIVILTKEISE